MDKLQYMTSQKFKNKVIIRTGIGSVRPLDPQHQHKGDFTLGMRKFLKNTDVIKLRNSKDILEAYKFAYNRKDNKHTILVEFGDYYNEK